MYFLPEINHNISKDIKEIHGKRLGCCHIMLSFQLIMVGRDRSYLGIVYHLGQSIYPINFDKIYKYI